MKCSALIYTTGGLELVNEIKPLWEKLNIYHSRKSTHFGEMFNLYKYEDRKNAFIDGDKKIFIMLVNDNALDTDIGYIIASVDNNCVGEVESLYIEEEYRGNNIGTVLMDSALEWIHTQEATKVRIGVAVGNENVLGLYEKYGFYPKVMILEQKK